MHASAIGDHHALEHTAGRGVRILVEAVSSASGIPTDLQQRQRGVVSIVAADVECIAQRVGDMLAIVIHRVERGHRVLE